MKKYAISDIHGCIKTFTYLLEKIEFTKKDELYILGDSIDRGPNSKAVFDFIMQLQEDNYSIKCIRGNHDQMMLDAPHNINMQRQWMRNGGWTTLEDFNAESLSDIPQKYFQFIEAMPYYYEVGAYILVHAGFKFYMPNPFDELDSMLWERDWYNRINYYWLKNRIIIHGHTPISIAQVKKDLKNIEKNQYLNIDGGCVFKEWKDDLGYLICFDLETQELIIQENIDFK